MDIAHSISSEITSLSFSFLSTDDVRSISVQKVDNPVLLDNVNLPNKGGLYDPKLGPMSAKDICETCNLSYFACPGHYGHIDLPVPVFQPLFMGQMFHLFRAVCLFCHHLKMPEMIVKQYGARIRLLDAGLVQQAHQVGEQSPAAAKVAGDEEGDEAAADIPAERAAEFVVRIEQFVAQALDYARKMGRTSDEYKDGLVYEERKRVLAEFIKAAQGWKRCSRCQAHGYTFRKEKAIKVIEYDLEPKKKLANATMGLKRRDVLPNGTLSKKAQRDVNMELDEGVEMSSASSESDKGDDISDSEEDEDEDMDDEDGVQRVAKTASGQVKGARGRNERVISAGEVRAHLRLLFMKETQIVSLLYGRHGQPGGTNPLPLADMFFMDVIPVTPTRFRPASKMGDDLFENAQNTLLTAIIQTGRRIQDLSFQLNTLVKGGKVEEAMEPIKKGEEARVFGLMLEAIIKLQHDVNSYMDSTKNPAVMRQGKLPPQGVKQVLEKKEGLFRKHMMGKRVNYAARSVISPDINIETNEIGVPPVFAKKLTYPEPVTQLNIAEMRQLVINGPKVHPGAAIVQNEDGTQISLDRMTLEQRTAIANQLLTPQSDAYASSSFGPASRNKKVYRHLRDGDIVILNRQPTLHKPSMMCHKVKVLKGEKTIRMHYANCNSYNADFDGDEMNIHFPQNEIARSEAYNIANTDNQYLVPTSGAPLRGLIQDHVDAGIWLCNKSTFFTREEYFQLIYGALRSEGHYTGMGRIRTVPPAIFKPKPMWTGKQIFSTILLNLTPYGSRGLNLTSKNKIRHHLWGRGDTDDPAMSEEVTHFLDGDLIRGVLDKSQYGAAGYGLVHSVYELYGPMIANRLLGVLSRVLTKYLQHRAFTCRMDDLILTPEGEAKRAEILKSTQFVGTKAALKVVGLPETSSLKSSADKRNLNIRLEETLRDDRLMAVLDSVTANEINRDITSVINREILPKCLVKSFPDNNMQTMTVSGAKGSAVNASQISTLLGQQALEGRRVPVMVSGKTLPSFKAFETAARAGGFIANRFLTGIRPQEYYFHCMSGREGLIDTAVKTARSGYLQRCLIKHLEGVKVHYDHTVRDSDSSVLQWMYGEDSLDVTKQTHLQHFDFTARNIDSLVAKYRPEEVSEKVVMDEAVEHTKKALKRPGKYPPALSVFSPSRYLGAMSERYAKELNEYVDDNKLGYIANKNGKTSAFVSEKDQVGKRKFLALSRVKYMRSLVDPGEAVGLLASQGIGEPSTQMTLNTFHLAGHGAANVTLGIPRLREIVMTASPKPASPIMQLPLREHTTEETAIEFTKEVSRLTVGEVVERVTVTEQLSSRDVEANNSRLRKYTVHLQFYPTEEYSAEYRIKPIELHEALAYNFAARLKKEIQAELRLAAKAYQQDLAVGQGHKIRESDMVGDENDEPRRRGRDDDLGIDNDDGDAGEQKRTRQARQHEYEEDERFGDLADLEDNIERLAQEDDEDEEALDIDPAQKAATDAQADSLADMFKVQAKWASSFSFDTINGKSAQFDLHFPASSPKLLLVDLIERCCRSSVIHEVASVGKCARFFTDKGVFTRTLETEGCNLHGMWAMADEHIDLDKIKTNDIYAILKTYGVEAARQAIITEMSNVFGPYGIKVDYRHLTVVADYMTHAGGYRPFNRSGISHKSSPLLKASFETTVAFLSEATLHGDFDDLQSPAGRIVMGRPGVTGTGSFDIRAPRRL